MNLCTRIPCNAARSIVRSLGESKRITSVSSGTSSIFSRTLFNWRSFSKKQTLQLVKFKINLISVPIESQPRGTSAAPRLKSAKSVINHSLRLSEIRPTKSPLFIPNSRNAQAKSKI